MIPDSLPILTAGLGSAAAGRACAMSAVSWLEGGEGNSDTPECVHPVLARAFVRVNDAAIWDDDDHRTRTLWPLIVRAMGTAPTGTDHERKVMSVRFAVVAAQHVLPLVRKQDREVCEAAIRAAEGWCNGTATQRECRDAADAAYAAYAANAAYVATYAAYAAAACAAANAYAPADANAAANAAYAAAHAACTYAADAVAAHVALLVALLDEHDRTTGRIPTPPPADRLAALCALVPTVTP